MTTLIWGIQRLYKSEIALTEFPSPSPVLPVASNPQHRPQDEPKMQTCLFVPGIETCRQSRRLYGGLGWRESTWVRGSKSQMMLLYINAISYENETKLNITKDVWVFLCSAEAKPKIHIGNETIWWSTTISKPWVPLSGLSWRSLLWHCRYMQLCKQLLMLGEGSIWG